MVMTTNVLSFKIKSGRSSPETSVTSTISTQSCTRTAEESEPLLSQSSSMASFAGWDSHPFTGASPDLPTNGDIYMHPYTITYCNESGVNNVVLHAYILSPVALRPSKSEHLGSARFESQLGHWISCLRILSFF
jgi:hypothetical protein